MNRVGQFVAIGLLGGIMAADAVADPVTITFDNPPCAATAGDYPGNCYADSGVAFISSTQLGTSSATFAITASDLALSPPNIAQTSRGFHDIHVFFVLPGALPGVTSFLSLSVVGTPPFPGGEPWHVILYGPAGELERAHGWSNEPVSFSRPTPDIRSFRIVLGSPGEGIDNLIFERVTAPNAAPVSEPSSLLLIGSGAAALVARRRRMYSRRPQYRASTWVINDPMQRD